MRLAPIHRHAANASDAWHTRPADRIRRGDYIRVFDGHQTAWALVEDIQKQHWSVTVTTPLGDYTYYRATRLVVRNGW